MPVVHVTNIRIVTFNIVGRSQKLPHSEVLSVMMIHGIEQTSWAPDDTQLSIIMTQPGNKQIN